jgi:hypothetical protein
LFIVQEIDELRYSFCGLKWGLSEFSIIPGYSTPVLSLLHDVLPRVSMVEKVTDSSAEYETRGPSSNGQGNGVEVICFHYI